MTLRGPTRAQIRQVLAPYARLARETPRNADALCALATQLVLWANGRRGDLIRAERLVRRAQTVAPERADLSVLAGRIEEDLARPMPAVLTTAAGSDPEVLSRLQAAVEHLRRAVAMRPTDRDYANYLLHLLVGANEVAEFRRLLPILARRHRVDLGGMRRALRREGLATDALTVYVNAFGHAYKDLTLRLWNDVEAFERRHAHALRRLGAQTSRERALVSRRANRVKNAALPTHLRPLGALAQKWGIGDDADRGELLSRSTPTEQRALRQSLSAPVRRRVGEWLEALSDAERASPEALAFTYLLEAYEELSIYARRRPAARRSKNPRRRPRRE